MSGWSTRNDGFVGPAQLQRLPPPPTRDFRRPPELPPAQPHHSATASLSSSATSPGSGGAGAGGRPQAKARNSFFAAFRNIGNVNPPIEPRPRRSSEASQGAGAGGREISSPQRLQPRHQGSLPPSVSAPALHHGQPQRQPLPQQQQQRGAYGQMPPQPRSTMERTVSSSRQASGALSDHGHGSAGTTTSPNLGSIAAGGQPGGGGGGHMAAGGISPGGTITAGSFAAMRHEDRRRASMVDLPLPAGEREGGGGGERLPTVQESPRRPAVGEFQQQQASPNRASQYQQPPQQQSPNRASQYQQPPPPQQQQQQQVQQQRTPERGSLDVSTSSSSAHFTPTPPSGGPLSTLHPELRSGIQLSIAHAHKIYFSGPLSRRLELEPSGRPPHRQEGWVDVWAQLGGTTLSVWEMRAIEEASKRGEEVPPSYINVTDAFIGVLGSIEIPATGTQPASKRTNILTLNTAGSNLLLFSAPSGQALVSWAAALRLATWEKSRLEEIYTGHLLRMSLMAPNGEFKQPKTALTRGKLEGWVRIRLAGQVDWKRVYAIITSAYDPLQSPNLPGSAKPSAPAFAAAISQHSPGLGGRPESPTSQKSPSVLTKRRMSGIFRSSGGGSQNGGHGSAGLFAHHHHHKQTTVDGVAPPVIAFHAAPPQGRKPKPPLLTLTHVTQAFALYPERPEMISKSNLFKIEALLGTEIDHTAPTASSAGGGKHKPKQEERFAGKMAGREGWCIVQPELPEDPAGGGSGGGGSGGGGGQKASLVMDMLKWLVAIHDAFGLYGRPAGYTWDPRDPTSMMFSYPVGPMRDHLFLDRELAESLDPNDDSTSSVRARLLAILLERMRGPPTTGSVSEHTNTIEEEEDGQSAESGPARSQDAPSTGVGAGGAGVPELPPLEFGGSPYENSYQLDLQQGVGAPPTAYNGGVRRSHSVLTKITEQSTVRGDSGDADTRQNSGGDNLEYGPDRERSLSRRSAFTEDLSEDGEMGMPHHEGDESNDDGDHTIHEDHTLHGPTQEEQERGGSQPTIVPGAPVVHSPEATPQPEDKTVQPPASPYAVAHAEVRASSPYAGSTHSQQQSQRSQRSGSPYSLPPAQRAASPYAVPSIAAAAAGRAASPYAAPAAPSPSAARPASPYTLATPRMSATSARAASPFAAATTTGETPFQTAPLPRTPGSLTGNGHQEPKDYGFPPTAEGHKPSEAAAAIGQSMISPRLQPLPASPASQLGVPPQDPRAVSPGLAPPKRVGATPPPQSPKLRAPTLESPKLARSPLGPPPTAPALTPAILASPPPGSPGYVQHRMTPDKLPSLQTTGLRAAVLAPAQQQQEKTLPPPPEYNAQTPFTDSPVQSDSPELAPASQAQPQAQQQQPLLTLSALGPLPAPPELRHSYSYQSSLPGTGRTSPASQYPPTEAGVTPAAVEEPPSQGSYDKPVPPPFRRQQTPIAFDRLSPTSASRAAPSGTMTTSGGAVNENIGGRQNGSQLGRKPSGARALPVRQQTASSRSTSTSPIPPHPQLPQATTPQPSSTLPKVEEHGPASPQPARTEQQPPAQQPQEALPAPAPAPQVQATAESMARPLPAPRRQSTRDSFGDLGDDALAALSYMQLDGSVGQRPAPPSGSPVQQRQPQPQTPPRQPTSSSASPRSPPPPQSPPKDEQVVFPSSFATSRQAAERKAKAQEQQQRRDEAVHKPGRPSVGQRLQAAAKRGTWARSSDEEEEEEDDDDEGSDEEVVPRGRQTSARPPRDISLPPNQIHAPLPQPVNTPSHRFEIEAPSPPQQARMNMLPPDQGVRQSSYSLASGVAPRGVSPGRAMGMGAPPSLGQDVQVDQGQYVTGGPYDPQQQQAQARMRGSGYPFPPVDEPRPQSQPRSRERYDSQERPAPMSLPNRQSVWTANLERDDAMPMVAPNTGNRNTFISLEPNETMTKAFTPHGLLQAGIQEKHDRSAKRQEEIARETGASLINVPSKPPPPQTGLLGAITAHERERNREGGMGATLTEREREKRMAEERQRRLDEYQRQQLDQAEHMGQGGQYDMYGNPTGFAGFNPMAGQPGMLHPMMTGMGGMGGMMPNPMMMSTYGMNPMMFGGMGGMMPFGGWPGAPGITPQQQQMAAQAAMEAYNRTMVAYSQVGSQPQSPAASEAGGPQNGNPAASNPALNRMSTASPPMMSPNQYMGGMGGMGGMGMGGMGMGMPGMGMMGMMSPQMMGMMGMPGGMGGMGPMSPMATGMGGMGGMGMGGMGSPMGMQGMQSMTNLSAMNSPQFNAQQQTPQSQPQSSPEYLAARNRYSSFTASSDQPQSRPLSGQNTPGTPARSQGANTPNNHH